jgi:hypothetical protein
MRSAFLGIAFLFLFSSFGKDVNVRICFGMVLVNSANTQIASFAVLTLQDERIIRTQHISVDMFILQASGKATSMANPDAKDIFSEWGISECYPDYEMYSNKYIGYWCPIINNLWKVRYKRDPKNAHLRQDEGWAKGYFAPSIGQMKYLEEEYGVRNMNEFFVGDKMFQLLKDVTDTVWINRYKDL